MSRNSSKFRQTDHIPQRKVKQIRENQIFLTITQNSPENEIRRQEDSLLEGADSSTSSTMESNYVTSKSGHSDGTDTSETLIYQIPKGTVQDVVVCRQRKHQPEKIVLVSRILRHFLTAPDHVC